MASQLHDGDSMGGNDNKKGKEKNRLKNWLGRIITSKREGGGIVIGGDENKGKEAKSGIDENKGKVAKTGKVYKGKEIKGQGNGGGEGDMHQKGQLGQVGQVVQMGPMGNYPVGPAAHAMNVYGSPNHQEPSQQEHAMEPYVGLFNDDNVNACAIM